MVVISLKYCCHWLILKKAVAAMDWTDILGVIFLLASISLVPVYLEISRVHRNVVVYIISQCCVEHHFSILVDVVIWSIFNTTQLFQET